MEQQKSHKTENKLEITKLASELATTENEQNTNKVKEGKSSKHLKKQMIYEAACKNGEKADIYMEILIVSKQIWLP